MRALRVLAHAEVETYLEAICLLLIDDLQRDLLSRSKSGWSRRQYWAEHACIEAKRAAAANNGVKKEDILKMFSPLGFSESSFALGVSNIFLDRMSTFGKFRGDVAHQSAVRAQYALTRQREEAFINEIMTSLRSFDKYLIGHRLTSPL